MLKLTCYSHSEEECKWLVPLWNPSVSWRQVLVQFFEQQSRRKVDSVKFVTSITLIHFCFVFVFPAHIFKSKFSWRKNKQKTVNIILKALNGTKNTSVFCKLKYLRGSLLVLLGRLGKQVAKLWQVNRSNFWNYLENRQGF